VKNTEREREREREREALITASGRTAHTNSTLTARFREVWPENDNFGKADILVEEEFLVLREIFLADLGGKYSTDQIFACRRYDVKRWEHRSRKNTRASGLAWALGCGMSRSLRPVTSAGQNFPGTRGFFFFNDSGGCVCQRTYNSLSYFHCSTN
jgi:hypothetical protein